MDIHTLARQGAVLRLKEIREEAATLELFLKNHSPRTTAMAGASSSNVARALANHRAVARAATGKVAPPKRAARTHRHPMQAADARAAASRRAKAFWEKKRQQRAAQSRRMKKIWKARRARTGVESSTPIDPRLVTAPDVPSFEDMGL